MEVAPWRLALVVVMQYIEGLTDRQAADAVRRCMDWKYALSLELTDPGFDFTLLHDFRQRLLTHEAAQRLLDTFLTTCKARGWLKARGTQRTDATHVLAAIRTLHRLECALEAMRYALNQLSDVAPAWVRQEVPLEWYTRYGLRSDQTRLPKDASKREALARQIGGDGYQLLDWVQAADTLLSARARLPRDARRGDTDRRRGDRRRACRTRHGAPHKGCLWERRPVRRPPSPLEPVVEIAGARSSLTSSQGYHISFNDTDHHKEEAVYLSCDDSLIEPAAFPYAFDLTNRVRRGQV